MNYTGGIAKVSLPLLQTDIQILHWAVNPLRGPADEMCSFVVAGNGGLGYIKLLFLGVNVSCNPACV